MQQHKSKLNKSQDSPGKLSQTQSTLIEPWLTHFYLVLENSEQKFYPGFKILSDLKRRLRWSRGKLTCLTATEKILLIELIDTKVNSKDMKNHFQNFDEYT